MPRITELRSRTPRSRPKAAFPAPRFRTFAHAIDQQKRERKPFADGGVADAAEANTVKIVSRRRRRYVADPF
jgi:hypothetical protein